MANIVPNDKHFNVQDDIPKGRQEDFSNYYLLSSYYQRT